jgi:ubiquitin-protein ligase
MQTLHQRRVANELELLEQLAVRNPAILQLTGRAIDPDKSRIDFQLLASPGLISENGILRVSAAHAGEIRLPRFFPAVPIEIYLTLPVFHPNIDPDNGFVCLWREFSSDHTCLEAVRRLRAILAWKMMNPNPLQVIQPEAITWLADPNREPRGPFEYEQLQSPESESQFIPHRPLVAGRRKRLLL